MTDLPRAQDLEPYALNIMFRSGHSYLWELAEKSGILGQLGLSLASLEEADWAGRADEALFNGQIDLIAGNHISPYYHVATGKPIVCIASPSNAVRGRFISREPLDSLADLKGKTVRIADCDFLDEHGGLRHGRGNHIIEVYRAGFEPEELEWIELGPEHAPGVPERVVETVRSGKADIGFGFGRDAAALEREGFHITELPTLPMINGSTITTSYEALGKKERLAERLVQAMVETIHFARVNPEEGQRLLSATLGKPYHEWHGRIQSVSRYRIKPYPDMEAVSNVYELSAMRYEEARTMNPFALWDMHYLRELDQTGLIDELIQEEPEQFRSAEQPSVIS
jgi:ABC-type nitrate/sulfonate/bicarbonate transport system substrate-binding protein